MFLISTIDKKPPDEVKSDLQSSAKSYDTVAERSPNRRLGIRDLPMPPMPSDADDDVDDDEVSEQDLRKTEDDLCDSIVKSFGKNKQASTSPEETYQQPEQQYVPFSRAVQKVF